MWLGELYNYKTFEKSGRWKKRKKVIKQTIDILDNCQKFRGSGTKKWALFATIKAKWSADVAIIKPAWFWTSDGVRGGPTFDRHIASIIITYNICNLLYRGAIFIFRWQVDKRVGCTENISGLGYEINPSHVLMIIRFIKNWSDCNGEQDIRFELNLTWVTLKYYLASHLHDDSLYNLDRRIHFAPKYCFFFFFLICRTFKLQWSPTIPNNQ